LVGIEKSGSGYFDNSTMKQKDLIEMLGGTTVKVATALFQYR
jgi:hypothetical protein